MLGNLKNINSNSITKAAKYVTWGRAVLHETRRPACPGPLLGCILAEGDGGQELRLHWPQMVTPDKQLQGARMCIEVGKRLGKLRIYNLHFSTMPD